MKFFLRLFPAIEQYHLSFRLVGYVVIISSLFALLATTTQLYLDYRRDVSSLYKSFSFIQKSYLHTMAVSTFKIDTDHLNLELEGALKLPDIVYLEVRELRGNQVYTHSKGNLNATKIIRKEYPLEYVSPAGEKRLMGTLIVIASLEGVYQRLWSRTLTILGTNMVKTFLTSACILAIIYFLITRHLIHMAHFTKRLVPGITNIQLTLDRKPSQPDVADELEQVVKSINNLQDRSAQDIAILRKTKEELIRAKQKYRTVADFTYDWEYWTNVDGSLEYVSPSCESISGYSVQDFKKNPALLREIIVPEDKKLWETHDLKFEKDLKPGELQLRIQRKDGTTRWIEHVCRPVYDEQGNYAGVRANNRDITNLRLAELEARENQEILARLNRTVNLEQLAGSIAHELNQPLTGILSNAQTGEMLLKRGDGNRTEIEEILTDIIADGKRSGDILRNLRDHFGRQKSEFMLLGVNKMVEKTIRLLNSEFVIQRLNIRLVLSDTLPDVMGNKIQLQQVMINLLNNAIQAMQNLAEADRSISIVTERKNGGAVQVHVEDTGPGIDPKQLESIFDSLATSKRGGLGMGLSISRSIVQAHGGRIWAENITAGGARISFTLPAAEVQS